MGGQTVFNSLFWHYWTFLVFFWPLLSFLSQKISFRVKFKCKWTLSTNHMLKTVFEIHRGLRFTVYLNLFLWPMEKNSGNGDVVCRYVRAMTGTAAAQKHCYPVTSSVVMSTSAAPTSFLFEVICSIWVKDVHALGI